jgi:hypothetical protein
VRSPEWEHVAVAGVCVVHLVWAPLGLAPLRRFVRSYRAHPAGCPHRLLVLFNGFSDGASLDAARAELVGVVHDEHVLDAPRQDLAAYRAALERAHAADALCFLNSHSEPLVDGWLAPLVEQLGAPGIGIAGATGSHESASSSAPRPLKPLRRRQFPPFPNPHVRTNAFALERERALALDWTIGRSKTSAHQLESGWRGLTRQLLDAGLEPRVVGRDGHGYAPEEWPRSATYRSGRQENLLIADNRTRQFDEASPGRRAELARMAWGAAADLSAPRARASRA